MRVRVRLGVGCTCRWDTCRGAPVRTRVLVDRSEDVGARIGCLFKGPEALCRFVALDGFQRFSSRGHYYSLSGHLAVANLERKRHYVQQAYRLYISCLYILSSLWGRLSQLWFRSGLFFYAYPLSTARKVARRPNTRERDVEAETVFHFERCFGISSRRTSNEGEARPKRSYDGTELRTITTRASAQGRQSVVIVTGFARCPRWKAYLQSALLRSRTRGRQ